MVLRGIISCLAQIGIMRLAFIVKCSTFGYLTCLLMALDEEKKKVYREVNSWLGLCPEYRV